MTHCVGSAKSKVLVELYGRRQHKAFATGKRPVEQHHVDNMKPRANWQVIVYSVCRVLDAIVAVGDKTALVH